MTWTGRLAEFWYLLTARLALLAGRRDRARAGLKQAIRRNPNGFMAHFLLGRVYWKDRAAVKARREFDLAWQIDPERFERAYARFGAQNEGVPELVSFASDAPRGGELPRLDARRTDDFRSESERRRFAALPPIQKDEITEIDWDRLEAEICRDD